jgi:hypothetical protein
MNEYSTFREPQIDTRSFERFDHVWEHQIVNAPQAHGWYDEYEKNWKDFNPAISPEQTSAYEKVYSEIQTGEDWAEEYNSKVIDELQEEAAWFSQFMPGGNKFIA